MFINNFSLILIQLSGLAASCSRKAASSACSQQNTFDNPTQNQGEKGLSGAAGIGGMLGEYNGGRYFGSGGITGSGGMLGGYYGFGGYGGLSAQAELNYRRSNDPFKVSGSGITGGIGYIPGVGIVANARYGAIAGGLNRAGAIASGINGFGAITGGINNFGAIAGGISNSGDAGFSFIFTENSREADLPDYNRSFIESKIFLFTSSANATFSLNFVSTSKSYHPQFKISERLVGNLSLGKNTYVEVSGLNKEYGMFSSKYACKKDVQYVVEIGSSEKTNTAPFENVSTGGFICSLAAGKKCMQESFLEEQIQVSVGGAQATCPTEQGKQLIFAMGGAAALNMGSGSSGIIEAGSLDYTLTPYFDEAAGTITTYFHFQSSGGLSSKLSSTSKAASSVHYSCSTYSASGSIFEGVESAANHYDFEVSCKSACGIITDLTRF